MRLGLNETRKKEGGRKQDTFSTRFPNALWRTLLLFDTETASPGPTMEPSFLLQFQEKVYGRRN